MPGAVAVSVAVNVTDWPNTDGFADALSAVLVSALLITCGLLVSDPVLTSNVASAP